MNTKNMIFPKNKKSQKIVLISLLLLYLIYEPAIFRYLFGIHDYYINVIFSLILCFLNIKKLKKIQWSIFKYIIITFTIGLYILFITTIKNTDIRFFQHIYVIFQVIILCFVNDYIDDYYENPYYQKIRIIKNIVTIEFIITLFMLLFPELKALAENLYKIESNVIELNSFIISKRVYGIFGDYTYKCQIFNGMLAFFFLWLTYVENNKKYIIYMSMTLLISLVNGRTGVLVFCVQLLIFFTVQIIKKPSKAYKVIKLAFIFIICISTIIIILVKMNPFIVPFIMNMFKGILGADVGSDNNIEVLKNTIYFPRGLEFLFGSGKNLYTGVGVRSDIGFCNDITLYGIIGVVISYINTVKFIKIKGYETNKRILNFCIVIGLVMANVKGVCMRSGTIIIGILWIKLICESEKGCSEL